MFVVVLKNWVITLIKNELSRGVQWIDQIVVNPMAVGWIQGGYKIDWEDTKCELPCTKAK